jgi:hypothetical protein
MARQYNAVQSTTGLLKTLMAGMAMEKRMTHCVGLDEVAEVPSGKQQQHFPNAGALANRDFPIGRVSDLHRASARQQLTERTIQHPSLGWCPSAPAPFGL